MKRIAKPTDYVFQASWEVCNKVGGIYTVLSTQAKTLGNIYRDNLIYIGPDLAGKDKNPLFKADAKLLAGLKRQAKKEGLNVRIGRWQVPGEPIAALVEFESLREEKNRIYAEMWEDFGVDSLHAYGDYDDACLFAWQAGRFAVLAYRYLNAHKPAEPATNLTKGAEGTAVFQAHEWMSAFGLLYVKKNEPQMGTIFTTHATSVGRSITTNNKALYAYFSGYNGDQMAAELNMQAKHSAEKAAALQADCLTTVSEATNNECRQFFGREADVILHNGFEPSLACKGTQLQTVRKRSRKALLNTYNALAGAYLTDNTLIVSTSGRNDFRCKGFDLFINALKCLQDKNTLKRDVLAVIAVPCWRGAARQDLMERLALKPAIKIMDASAMEPLPNPFITHELHNFADERIVQTIYGSGMRLDRNEKVHLLFIPSYLDGEDGVLNLPYYEFLAGCDYCIYPSYYEPWGYTPLESAAFGIPCLTTSLSGFGQWVSTEVGHQPILSDGVAVIPRNDDNYDHCVDEIATSLQGMTMLAPDEWRKFSDAAHNLAKLALWKDFIHNYLRAYMLAMKQKSSTSNS